MAYSWDDLAALSLARQFPKVAGRGAAAVAQTVARIGPIQAQTARSPFLGLAARIPGVRLEDICAAYDELLIVRGSNIRGTVHTCTPPDHALLEAATRIGQRALWARMLKLKATTLEQVWEGMEDYARDDWRTPQELLVHLRRWLERHDPTATPAIDTTAGRYLGFGHGGLLRKPLKGGWQAQGAPGYRTASVLLGDRSAVLADPHGALDAIVRRHLSAYGPASRHDIAWWSGLGLRVVDAALTRVAGQTTGQQGPDGRIYHDLLDVPAAADPPDIRLLPEFDALLCGYDPKARDRFVSAKHYRRLWFQDNGALLAPMLYDGRLSGYWRLFGAGSKRSCEVAWFAGTRRPRKSELDGAVAALEAAYGVTVMGVTITRDP